MEQQSSINADLDKTKKDNIWRYIISSIIVFLLYVAVIMILPGNSLYINGGIAKAHDVIQVLERYSNWYKMVRIIMIIAMSGTILVNVANMFGVSIDLVSNKRAGHKNQLVSVYVYIIAALSITLVGMTGKYVFGELTNRNNICVKEIQDIKSNDLLQLDARVLLISNTAKMALGAKDGKSPYFIRCIAEDTENDTDVNVYIPYEMGFDSTGLTLTEKRKNLSEEDYDGCEYYQIKYTENLHIVTDIQKIDKKE